MIKRYAFYAVRDHDVYVCSDIDPILKTARDVAGALLICHALEYDCKRGECGACDAARLIIEKTEGLE